MAKKHIAPERNTNPTKNSSGNRSKMKETANGEATSREEEAGSVAPSSDESVSGEVADSDERRSSSGEEEEEREEKGKSISMRAKKHDAKSARKKRSREEKEESEKRENQLYTFPMKRIGQIIRSDIPDLKISQEAVFLINKASEKFLQLFGKEAYTCTFLEKKKQIAYNHLASVVSKRKRFEFLSDIVPEKVKFVDAFALVEEVEK